MPVASVKLALVTETFPPEINGVAMTLGNLATGLSARGFAVTVHRPRQPAEAAPTAASAKLPAAGSFREVLYPGLPIPGYPLLRLGLPARGRLLRAWRAERPDVVHVATEGPLGWSALSAADALGIPLASSFHTNFHSYSKHYGFNFLTRPALAYLRWFHNRTRITLSPTDALNAELTRDGFRGMKLLSRGVDTTHFTPSKRDPALRASWGADPDDPVFLHVSRVAAEKNYALLFRAWSEVRAAHPRARFVLVSDGPLRKKLQRDHPWTTFTGFVDRDALARLYASADIFVYPSQTETFGNVVTEAMASGLAVCAYEYAAAARYLKHRETGWLAPFGDESALLAGTHALATDAELRNTLRLRARATAETIPWSSVIDGFARDLREVAAGAS
ncbi:MAG: glycosyltransferase family 1 protein [Verrucomicrobia bacterium]|nr:glycosyltransferase family 1 protein [Verrucomicrobiota bacterium]